jgi:hypothetical protein
VRALVGHRLREDDAVVSGLSGRDLKKFARLKANKTRKHLFHA